MISKVILRIRIKAMFLLSKLAGMTYAGGHFIYVHGLKAKPVVIDLGTNKGAFSQKMIDLFDADCYAIEANKILYESLSLTSGKKFNLAINDKDGPLTFYVSDNHEASSIIENFQTCWGQSQQVQVEGVSWKTLLNKINLAGKQIDILKIDIEGAELALIESFSKEDLQNVKQITIEFHDWLNKDLQERTVGCIKKLNKLGFQGFTVSRSHEWPVEVLFLNKKITKLSLFDKFKLNAFNAFAILKYKD